MKEQLVSFETAVLAKYKGFSIGSRYSIIEYLSDFVYDNDPSHRESHKVGELRSSEFFNKNNADVIDFSNEYYRVYEQPTQTILQKWLRETHNINISIDFKFNIKKWDYIPYDMGLSGKEYVKFRISYFKGNIERRFDSYEKALEAGLQEVLKLIKSQ